MDEIKVKRIEYTTAIVEYRGKEYKCNIKHSASHGYYVEFMEYRYTRRISLDIGKK